MKEKNYLISPSILSADFTQLGDQIRQAEQAGADWFHIDIMDGHYVPNLSMGPAVLEACRRTTDLPLDVHLMIEEPDRYLENFISAGADYLTVHIETCPEIEKTINRIHDLGCKSGITLNPGTDAEMIKPFINLVDLVLVMTVQPGFSGQSFMPEILPKINTIRKMINEIKPEVLLEVDGGINPETIRSAYDQGACVFVAASAIFNHPQGIQAGMDSLLNSLES
jgi:ribulose-phosphate 3-epimerase